MFDSCGYEVKIMFKLNNLQINSLENVKDRNELCEKIFNYIINNPNSFIEYNQLKNDIYIIVLISLFSY